MPKNMRPTIGLLGGVHWDAVLWHHANFEAYNHILPVDWCKPAIISIRVRDHDAHPTPQIVNERSRLQDPHIKLWNGRDPQRVSSCTPTHVDHADATINETLSFEEEIFYHISSLIHLGATKKLVAISGHSGATTSLSQSASSEFKPPTWIR